MDRRVISLCLSLSLVLLFAGCASKKVASSSGDQSGQAKTEAILEASEDGLIVLDPNGVINTNRFLLAISANADPTGTWKAA